MLVIKKATEKCFSTPEKARELFERWKRYFLHGDLNLTVRLLLERAVFQNITTYRVSREMLALCKDFCWGDVAFPSDFKNLVKALKECKEGEYVGFSIDQNAVWHRENIVPIGIKLNNLK